jgi:hypothetical protein
MIKVLSRYDSSDNESSSAIASSKAYKDEHMARQRAQATHLLGKVASAIGRVQDLVVEYGEVEG